MELFDWKVNWSIQCQTPSIVNSEASSCYNIGWRKHNATTYISAQNMREMFFKKISRLLYCEMLYEKSSQDDGTTSRTTWWTNFLIQPNWSGLLRKHRSKVPTTHFEKMVLPLHLSNNESSAHRSRTVIGHRLMSNCTNKSYCLTWLPKYNHHWQRYKLCRPSNQM